MPLRDMSREQAWLLPPSRDELMPLDHPARFAAEFVDALAREDWKDLGVEIEGDPLGAPAYHPKALLSVWLFGFVTGIRSSRKLEAACRDQIPYLWLTGWQHPDHNTLWRSYKDHRQAMRSLFKRTVRTAVAMELVDLAVQAVDGTKVAANASSNRSYDAEGLSKLLERLDRAIAEMEDQNEGETDRAPVHLPEELADKRTLSDQVRRAMDELEDLKGRKSINLTDRDARFMKMRHGFLPAYNAQTMVSPLKTGRETSGMLVTAVELVDEPADYARLVPMPQGAEESEVLFTLIAERYERRSLGITSNLVFSEWERIFANPMATAAAIDRVVHHSVILEFDVPSYRTDAAQQRGREQEVNRQI